MRSIVLNIYLLSTLLSAVPLNKPCIGLPAKINAQSLVALVNVGVQDINVLSNPLNQQCTENSTDSKDSKDSKDNPSSPLSHILDQIPVLSA
jgi:hypothetical protein